MSSAVKITRCFVALSTLVEIEQTTVGKCGIKTANVHVFQDPLQLVKAAGCPCRCNFLLPAFHFCPVVEITGRSICSPFEAHFNLHHLPLSQIYIPSLATLWNYLLRLLKAASVTLYFVNQVIRSWTTVIKGVQLLLQKSQKTKQSVRFLCRLCPHLQLFQALWGC